MNIARSPINTASQDKALRGTKRLCQTCEIPFYDLLRQPIVCPSCGAHYTHAPRPIVEAQARAASLASKTGWRNKIFKRPGPTLPAVEAGASSEPLTGEDATEEIAGPVPEDDIVLEQEPDDADVSGLVDHTVANPKEQ